MKTLELDKEESVIVHNAVIFMANDLMEEITDAELWLADQKEDFKKLHQAELDEKKRRWEVMVNLTKRVE